LNDNSFQSLSVVIRNIQNLRFSEKSFPPNNEEAEETELRVEASIDDNSMKFGIRCNMPTYINALAFGIENPIYLLVS